MNLEVVKQNAYILFTNINANYSVDDQGQLSVIAWWHFRTRILKWFHNRDGSVTRKINNAVIATLTELNAAPHYLRYQGELFPHYQLTGLVRYCPQFSNLESISEIYNIAMKFAEEQDVRYPNTSLSQQQFYHPVSAIDAPSIKKDVKILTEKYYQELKSSIPIL
jgi:hypothetical protein